MTGTALSPLAPATARRSGRAAMSRRREELLSLAADLFAERGFANVTVDDIGDAAGISGPALYHHFAGKEALLGEMLVRISRSLLAGANELRDDTGATAPLLDRLVRFHCEFAVSNRSLIRVHFRDLVHAPEPDERQVRRLQAQYASIWTSALTESHGGETGGIDRTTARAAVHAAFGLINSTPFARGVSEQDHVELLTEMAGAALAAGRAVTTHRRSRGSPRPSDDPPRTR